MLKDLVPPHVLNLIRNAMHNRRTFNSYGDALSHCGKGYEDDDIAPYVIAEKTKIYRDAVLSAKPFLMDIFAMRTYVGLSFALSGSELNVIDFGGACGIHYFIAKQLFGGRVRMRWFVVETPRMVKEAKTLENDELRFYDDLDMARKDIGRLDIVFSSGALQYVSNPYDYLEKLTTAGSRCLYMTRIGLTTELREIFSIQESSLHSIGPGPLPNGVTNRKLSYPVTFVRKDLFELIIGRHYSVQVMFDEDRAVYTAGGIAINTYGYHGMLSTRSP